MANKFVGLLETLGKDFEKGLVEAVKYLPAVGSLVSLIFPASAATVTTVTDATTLIQNAVVAVEQKYAASGVQKGTGAQKLAEVLTLAQQAVASLLAQAGITADESYVANLVNAVVAILNVQSAPVAPTPAA